MAAYGSAQSPYYGYQAAKNTTSYPTQSAPAVSPSTTASTYNPATAQTAKNTTSYTGTGGTFTQPVTPLSQPAKTVNPNPPPSSPQPSSAPAAAPATTALYDYTTDPVLQQVQAQAQAAEEEAKQTEIAGQNQLAIQYGDPNMALDAASAAAASANPYSVYGALAGQEPLDQQALDETLNKQNLFYSGSRINQQGQLAQQYGQKRADAATQEQQSYSQLQATLLAAQQQAEQQVAQAETTAYQNYLQQLLSGMLTPAASSSGGGGGAGGGGGDASGSGSSPNMGTNMYGGANPPVAPGTPAPATVYAPYTTTVTANPTGGSANKRQGTFSIH